MINQPLLDAPPPDKDSTAAPPVPAVLGTPRIRRYLLISSCVLLSLAVVNCVLFGRDGVDLLFAWVLVSAVPGFLYPQFWRVMRILKWFWVILTIPGWLLALFLGYHMTLGYFLELSAPPLPPEGEAGSHAKSFAAYRELTRLESKTEPWRWSSASPGKSKGFGNIVSSAAGAMRRVTDGSEKLLTFIIDPTLQADLQSTETFLDEFMEISLRSPTLSAGSPDNRQYNSPVQSYWSRSHTVDAEFLRAATQYMHGHKEEAQDRYLRILRSHRKQMEMKPGIRALHQEAVSLAIGLERQNRLLPELTRGQEEQVIEELALSRTALGAHIDEAWLLESRQFAGQLRLMPLLPAGSAGWRDPFLVASPPSTPWPAFDPIYRWQIFKLEDRLMHWPFLLPKTSYRENADYIQSIIESYEQPFAEVAARLHGKLPNYHVRAFEPNPGGRLLSQYATPYQMVPYLRKCGSIVSATEYLLAWQARLENANAPPPIDPMTGRPFFVKTDFDPHIGIETLQLAGGVPVHSLAHHVKLEPLPLTQPELTAQGLEKDYLFLLETTRSAR